VVGDAGDDVGVDVTFPRSIGTPSTVIASPLRVSRLPTAMSTKSACRPAVIRVVSAFQKRMSNAGGRLPSR
jgi:hypothetical protein